VLRKSAESKNIDLTEIRLKKAEFENAILKLSDKDFNDLCVLNEQGLRGKAVWDITRVYDWVIFESYKNYKTLELISIRNRVKAVDFFLNGLAQNQKSLDAEYLQEVLNDFKYYAYYYLQDAPTIEEKQKVIDLMFAKYDTFAILKFQKYFRNNFAWLLDIEGSKLSVIHNYFDPHKGYSHGNNDLVVISKFLNLVGHSILTVQPNNLRVILQFKKDLHKHTGTHKSETLIRVLILNFLKKYPFIFYDKNYNIINEYLHEMCVEMSSQDSEHCKKGLKLIKFAKALLAKNEFKIQKDYNKKLMFSALGGVSPKLPKSLLDEISLFCGKDLWRDSSVSREVDTVKSSLKKC